jgi:glutathione S-transferase
MHSGFRDLREQLSMEFVRQLRTPELREATRTQIARIVSAWTDALDRHAGLDGFLFGRFSIADCMYAPVVSRFRTYGIPLPPLAQTYCDRIWSLPAMRDWAVAAQKEVDSGLA